MKKILFLLLCLSFTAFNVNAQVVQITADITTNTNWTKNNIYVLNGFIYVTNNATLTIEKGTVIKGDQASKGSLIITRGAKLIADGTINEPIVFTSNQPVGQRSYGDWGGLLFCGKAPLNDPAGERVLEGGIDAVKGLYGGTDPDDNSGILRHVRVEYPGIAFQPNNETNGITFGGVGRGTIVDFVQVSYSGDDAFEWFGGTVNCKHLIAVAALDDDFDTDYGFSGNIQFGVVIRDPNVADVSGSNGFESDNDATGTNNIPYTKPVFTNISVFGPLATSSTTINSNYKRALHIRRSSKTSVFNSVFTGYPTGLKIDGTSTAANVTANELRFRNNILAGCNDPLDSTSMSFGMNVWFNANVNTLLSNSADVMVANPFNLIAPDFMPLAGSPLLSGGDFTDSYLSNPFFTQVSYRGAFGTTNWASCWTEFDPQNRPYTAATFNPLPVAGFSISNTGNTYNFTNISSAATTYLWDFGVLGATSTIANPSYTYPNAGNYTVSLTAFGPCGENISTQTITITLGMDTKDGISVTEIYPNPARENINLKIESIANEAIDISIYTIAGTEVATYTNLNVLQGENNFNLNTESLNNGIYLIKIQSTKGIHNKKLMISK